MTTDIGGPGGALLPLAVLLPFAAALVVALLRPRHASQAGWVILLAALSSVAILVSLASGETAALRLPWLPAIDVSFALRGDPFGLFLGLLVSGVGALIALYAIPYMADEPDERVRRFFSALGVFMGAMLGIALADDLILLFVFWEITSISSFLLIGYRYDEERGRAGALLALQVTGLGGLVMSVGLLLLGQIAGTFSLSGIAGDPGRVATVLASPLATPALLLILVGAFTKSAQFPFHFWLPRAMVAPTPVSAYLHAATMVKAGVFLLGRMWPIFGASPIWAPLLVAVGGISLVLGSVQSFRETDLKAILARTTGAMLGLITLLYGLGAAQQDVLQMLNHALYKGTLFLVAGIVEHRVHTRDLRELGGLRHDLPWAFVAAVIAALSMAGAPPLLGFVAKESMWLDLLEAPYLEARPLLHGVVILGVLGSMALMAAVACKFVVGVFLGPKPARLGVADAHGHASEHGHTDAHSERPPLAISPLVLAGSALLLGLLALGKITEALVAYASSAPGAHPHVSVLPALGPPLLLSFSGLAIAAVLYLLRERLEALQNRLSVLPAADGLWNGLVDGAIGMGAFFSTRWQNGSLRWYLAGTTLAVPIFVGVALDSVGLSARDIALRLSHMSWYGTSFCALLAVATLLAVRARTRLAAAIATTTIGFLVAMLFVVYRSPDILLTQILIETVSTIFVLLVLIFLPSFPKQDLARPSRIVHFAIAGAFSLAIVVLLLLAMTPGMREESNMSNRPGGLLSLALAEGGGANAVNVIIVDIRAMDTTGEITVLVIVGLCIYGLLRTRRTAP